VHAPFPCFLFALRSALPWSSAPCPALTLFVLLSVSLVGLLSLACVALRGACDCVVLCSCWCFSLSFWLLVRSSLCLGGPCCSCCCLPSFGLVPFPVPFAFPPRWLSRVVLWASLYLGVLVPPSGYLVAAVTAQLPCLHAGSVGELRFPSVIRFMATKATGPVWGIHPLHHVTGDVKELSLSILRYSS